MAKLERKILYSTVNFVYSQVAISMRSCFAVVLLGFPLLAQQPKTELAMTKPGSYSQEAGKQDSSSSDPYAILYRRYYGGFPISCASEVLKVRGAKEHLNSLLKRWDSRQSWPNTTFVLALSGDPRAVEWLIDFLQEDNFPPEHPVAGTVAEPLDPDVYDAKISVPYSLGLLVNKFDFNLKKITNSEANQPHINAIARARRKALDFLVSHSSQANDSWKELSWSAHLATKSDAATLHRDLSLRCLEGLAVSGDREALEQLNTLKKEQLQAPFANAVLDALATHAKVRETTLKQYLSGLGDSSSTPAVK